MPTAVLWIATVGFSFGLGQGAEEDPLTVDLRGNAIWAFAWGTASARNSLTGFERGEDLDLRDDFGLLRGTALADSALRLTVQGRHRIVFHDLFGSFSQRTVLDRTFEYNDNVFQKGEHARTNLEIDLRDLEYAAGIFGSPTLNLWAGAGGRWSHLNVGVRSSTLDPAGSMEENTAIYPTLNVAGTYSWTPSMSLALEVRGSPAAVPLGFSHASLGRFVELRSALAWRMTEALSLEMGGVFAWVWQRWRGRESDRHYAVNYVDLLLAGPFLGLEISF